MEIIIYVVVFVVGWAVGYARGVKSVAEIMIQDPDKFRDIMRMAQKAREELQLTEDMQHDRETVIDMEHAQGQYYAYTAAGEFLAQGSSFGAVFGEIKTRYPGRSFRINKHNPTLTEEQSQHMMQAVLDTFSEKPKAQSDQNT